jgi:hypothetical protein
MADEPIITPVQLQRTQIDVDRELLRDEDLLNEEHLRRMDQVLLRRNLDHARMFSRKLSLELQQYVHLYTPEANELRRRIEKYLVMERMIEREMARRHTYGRSPGQEKNPGPFGPGLGFAKPMRQATAAAASRRAVVAPRWPSVSRCSAIPASTARDQPARRGISSSEKVSPRAASSA